MKISLKWLNEFFPDAPAGKDPLSQSELLRTQLPLSGLEIGGWQRLGQGLDGVIVGQILEFQKHPNADKLNVCKVATGGETLQIVCGAPNVKQGVKVAVATIGTVLPGDFKIKQSNIRGVDSFGMLCSERELALSEESEGILHLADSAPVGSGLVKALNLIDEVWEVELTPDRGDCLSHLGVAREVGRLLSLKPVLPEFEKLSASDTGDVPMLSVEVQAPKACPIYGAQLLEGIQEVASPEWMRRRLEKIGVRSHDVLVDVTNYVLMELGHPLHAFDADKIAGSKIIVRFARPGEKLVTLDGETRTLGAEDLVIADAEKPVALAGVMGGLESGVTAQTRRIVLESALFDMNLVRATARRHKIHSDASHRFERGVDAAGCARAAGRAATLLKDLTKARRRGSYVATKNDKAEKLLAKHSFNFNLRTYKDAIGMEAPPEELIRAFQSVGIEAQVKSANVLKVDVPTHRLDLVREIDLVEEAARLIGYDKIPARYPEQLGKTRALTEPVVKTVARLRHRLVEMGLVEMMPYAFISAARARFTPQAQLVELKNPLSAEWQFMRPNLSFGLLEVVARHAGLGQLRGAFFDTGAAFEGLPAGQGTQTAGRTSGCRESWHAAWALMGPRLEEQWSNDKTSRDRKAAVDVFDAKGVAQKLHEGLSGIEGRWASVQYLSLFEALENPAVREALGREAAWIPVEMLHPGRSALMVFPGKPPGTIVGYVGELHPASKRDLLNLPAGLQLGVALGEVRVLPDLVQSIADARSAAVAAPRGRILPSRRLPVVERDLAFVFRPETKAAEIERSFRKLFGPELLDVRCIDRFEMPDGRVSLAWRFELQGVEKTLADAEISALLEKAIQTTVGKLGAELRA